MKLQISTAILLKHLEPCADIVEPRSALNYGKCALITVTKQTVTIRSFNLPLSIRSTITGDAFTVSQAGMVAVPAVELRDRLRAMKDDQVTLSSDGVKLTIKGQGTRKYTVACYTGEDFPAFPARPTDEVVVSAESLASVLRRVVYAVHDDLSMPTFCGVTLVAANDTMVASASNGHRIARASSPTTGNLDTFVQSKAALVLIDALEKGDVRIASSDRLVSFAFDALEMVYLRPSAEAPAYDQVIASLTGTDGPVVDRRALIAALKGITVEGTSGTVPIEIRSTGTAIVVRNMAGENESIDEIACESTFKWVVYVEAKYLIEALRNWDEDDVKIIAQLSAGSSEPLVLKCAGPNGGLATIGRVAPAKEKEAA